jgi:hypothetical protein
LPGSTTLHCAVCEREIDLESPTADHHPRCCPNCGVESAYLNWKSRILQIVPKNAPPALAAVLRWGQQHLDELEYVEFICALEEIADALSVVDVRS